MHSLRLVSSLVFFMTTFNVFFFLLIFLDMFSDALFYLYRKRFWSSSFEEWRVDEVPKNCMRSRPQCTADAVTENILNFLNDLSQIVQLRERMVTNITLFSS
jgi:hypothetical protein